MESVQTNIEKQILRYKKGALIFPADFRGLGSIDAIKMGLSRLTAKGKLRRLSHGIYYVPKSDPLLGELYPSPEKVATTIARKEKVRIKPTGSQALHLLGLSTQVPTKLVYLTDGERRQIKMGNTLIEFKPTTPRKLAFAGELSSLVILALMEVGTQHLNKELGKKIKAILLQEEHKILARNLKMAPAQIYNYINNLLNEKNDWMVKPDS
ncbi:DUF6088 family protein [Chitinophaga sp. 22321]|uniref:Type IV toxin-antitoxin system AbiEi family antitoxin domain-containing protein n=1 Tax=Chitinophaga hostae TaxID=2831022 RepID=A0ABS5IXM1_9BACT|nr:DUF6088 family protein [Chitinophaga hostae]MBS0027583.1 type IV toxin-antitoxin system AbiEi family antitoxin domain-containing protein [Chitinophaga hostae]